MSRHLEPVPDPAEEGIGDLELWDDADDLEPLRRPSWWRPVAIVVVAVLGTLYWLLT